ncbi:putative membrane protein [Mycoplasmoides fastidiosum]|uniref:Membrane protein n=1 Tax=Mycoplasmoides fastidiosum TaxID=92758 RepID=A0ABU0LZ35_9BACT|nr:hypothetical protein [Mycoplasmoides fastidiosum]MDQ0513964.1 putative membrane protein [Mycoplasmoides fastidiosum]UUD37622.1 hypothetical protein NPA10_03580 [Mycoplasmoides fastidiosum]
MNETYNFQPETNLLLQKVKTWIIVKLVLHSLGLLFVIISVGIAVSAALQLGVPGQGIAGLSDLNITGWLSNPALIANQNSGQVFVLFVIGIALFANLIIAIFLYLNSAKLMNTPDFQANLETRLSNLNNLALISLIFQYIFPLVSFISDIVFCHRVRKFTANKAHKPKQNKNSTENN